MGQIQNTCCSGQSKLPRSLLEEAQLLKIQQDYEYFFQQDWFGGEDKQLFEAQKFILFYNDYKNDQITMNQYWQRANLQFNHTELVRQPGKVLNVKFQYLIRKGVPCSLSRAIILDTFKLSFVDCQSIYNQTIRTVFKNKPIPKTFKHVPIFGCQTREDDDDEFQYLNESQKKIQLILQCYVLNSDGIEALIRLLWVVQQQHGQLEYNPMLLHIIVLLLIYLNEAQVYSVLEFLINDSVKQNNDVDLRWHLVMNEAQFKIIALQFYETVSNRSSSFSTVYDRMRQLSFDHFELFQEMSISLMLAYLPFSLALKVFQIYLNEGIKIYFRIFYAALRLLKDDLLACKQASSIKQIFRTKLLNLSPDDCNNLLRQAFKLQLNNAQKIEQASRVPLQYIKNQPCYLPTPSEPSGLLTSEQFEIVWDWLPSDFKLYDPQLIFSTAKDGFSLKYLYKKCEVCKYQPLLMIILTETSLFGVVSDVMLQINPNYQGSDDCFVFSFTEMRKYPATQINHDHMLCSSESLLFGSGAEGPAFQIDADLHKGHTHRSETYNNALLSGNSASKSTISNEYQMYIFYLLSLALSCKVGEYNDGATCKSCTQYRKDITIPKWGELIGTSYGVPAYSNDGDPQIRDPKKDQFIKFYGEVRYTGQSYQCVQYARRFLIQKFGVSFDDINSAEEIFQVKTGVNYRKSKRVFFKSYKNGGSVAPKRGDLLIWKKTDPDFPYGHVAVVVGRNYTSKIPFIAISEQNYDNIWDSSQYARRLEVQIKDNKYTVINKRVTDRPIDSCRDYDGAHEVEILGWVRIWRQNIEI